jgi:hypothetical protein
MQQYLKEEPEPAALCCNRIGVWYIQRALRDDQQQPDPRQLHINVASDDSF